MKSLLRIARRASDGKSLTGRSVQGTAMATLAQGVQALQGVILVPLFLSAWGPALYGRWVTVTALVAYLSLVDLGGQLYIQNIFGTAVVKGDKVAARRILEKGISVYCALGIACFLILAALLFTTQSLMRVADMAFLEDWEIAVILLLAASMLLVSMPGGIYVAAYRASGLFARAALLSVVVRLGTLGICAVLLWRGARPEVYAYVTLLATIGFSAFVIFDCESVMELCRKVPISLQSAGAGIEFVKKASSLWVLSLAGTVSLQGLILALAWKAGPVAVATYSTHRILAVLAGYVPSIFQGPLLPEMCRLYSEGRREELRRISIASIKLCIVLTGCACLALWLISPILYPYWSGRKLTLDGSLLALLLVQAVLAAGWNTSSWCLLASNNQRPLGWFALGNAIATVGIAVVVAPRGGVVGVVTGSLIADLFFGLAVFPSQAAGVLGMRRMAVFRKLAEGFAVVTACAIAAFLVRKVWGSVAGVCIVLVFAGVATAWILRAAYSGEDSR